MSAFLAVAVIALLICVICLLAFWLMEDMCEEETAANSHKVPVEYQ